MRRISRGLCLAVAALVFGVSLCAEGADLLGADKKPVQAWQLGLTPSYTSGNYGTNSTTLPPIFCMSPSLSGDCSGMAMSS